ncbi:MAG: SulP family inorganic anion transporter [Burkholderiales bacterium]
MFYEPPRWRDDLPAALIVACLLLPQSLAYALLAGLPPVAGVMASTLPLIAYALLGTSRTLAVGPVAVLALMTAAAIGPLAQEHGVPALTVALVIALQMAALMALAALLKLDALASLLSAPVLHGFIGGAALAIALGQVPKLLGSSLPGSNAVEWVQALPHAAAPVGMAVLLGGGSLALLLLMHRFLKGTWARLGPLAVVALAIAVVALLPDAQRAGLPLTGVVRLQDGLQFSPAWSAPAALWWAALPASSLMALVAYVEGLAVAQALAARRGERVQPRRELRGLAAANAAAGLVGGQPVTGGLARSGVAFEAGARTRWAGAFTAVAFVLLVALASPVLALLPQAVLAAVVILAVLPLVEPGAFVRAWHYSRSEGALMVAVALLVLTVGVELALALGVAASVALLLQRTARPHWAEVGRLPGSEVYRNVKRFEVERLPGVLMLRIDEGLCFTNARWLQDVLWAETARRPEAKQLVLMMSGVNDIDLSGLEALRQFAADWRAQGGQLHLSELKGPVADRLLADGLHDWLPGRVFRTQSEAWAALQ